MNSSPGLNHDSLSSIATARRAWLDAMRSSDIDRLAAMVTDDIVVIHGKRALRKASSATTCIGCGGIIG